MVGCTIIMLEVFSNLDNSMLSLTVFLYSQKNTESLVSPKLKENKMQDTDRV